MPKYPVIFIDRDGTLIEEPSDNYQVDSLDKLTFLPGVFHNLRKIVHTSVYQLVIITNQDGLGTDAFPEAQFWPAHEKMLAAFAGEEIYFKEVLIDRTFKHEGAPTRKPGTGLLTHYMNGAHDLKRSFVIGDRDSDMLLAQNMGAKGILLGKSLDTQDNVADPALLDETIVLKASHWNEIGDFFSNATSHTVPHRQARISRNTRETQIEVFLDLDGTGNVENHTGIGFFDHMLDQLGFHSRCDLNVQVKGDLHIDAHHTIEDTGIAIGEAFLQALGDKRGIERYGFFLLPMDEALARVALDFSGRHYLQFEAKFQREKVGEMPTEMVEHFFYSFADASKCTLHITAEGKNDHHIIESIFKGVAKSIRQAITQNKNGELPSTKGKL